MMLPSPESEAMITAPFFPQFAAAQAIKSFVSLESS